MSGVTWKHNVEEQKLGSWGRTKVLIGGEELQNVLGGREEVQLTMVLHKEI